MRIWKSSLPRDFSCWCNISIWCSKSSACAVNVPLFGVCTMWNKQSLMVRIGLKEVSFCQSLRSGAFCVVRGPEGLNLRAKIVKEFGVVRFRGWIFAMPATGREIGSRGQLISPKWGLTGFNLWVKLQNWLEAWKIVPSGYQHAYLLQNKYFAVFVLSICFTCKLIFSFGFQ